MQYVYERERVEEEKVTMVDGSMRSDGIEPGSTTHCTAAQGETAEVNTSSLRVAADY
jgi:hypothetical protein